MLSVFLTPSSPCVLFFSSFSLPVAGLVQALERQKEYSDLIQDERDALRDEVFRLRDALKVEQI